MPSEKYGVPWTDELTWETVMQSGGPVELTMRVLSGGGTPAERLFVFKNMEGHQLLSIAIANAGNFKVTVEKTDVR